MISCKYMRDNLNRFLDNDLNGRAATDMAEHLYACTSCHHAYDQERAVRTALHGLSAPKGGDAARERIFVRLERAVRDGVVARRPWWKRTGPPRGAWPLLAWRPAVATLAVAGVAAGMTFLPAVFDKATTDVPLPDPAEMSTLYHLHDAHGASLSGDEPIVRRDITAEAHAALLSDADAAVTGSL